MNHLEVSKLIGAPNSHTWAQVHVFDPRDEIKKKNHGQLLTVFSLKSRNYSHDSFIDVTSFGKEIITRFHEVYYSAKNKDLRLENLKQAFEVLQKEFGDKVLISGAAAAIINSEGKKVAYFARLAGAKIFIKRENQLICLLDSGKSGEIETLSGFLANKDKLALGTDKVFEIIPLGSLQAALQLSSLDQANQILNPIIHGHKENSLSAMVIAMVNSINQTDMNKKENFVQESSLKQEALPASQVKKSLKFAFIKNSFQLVKEKNLLLKKLLLKLLQKKSTSDIKVSPCFEEKNKSKKMAISVAIIFLILLGLSVGLGFNKKQHVVDNKQETEILSATGYNLEQAKELENLNPGRAKSLLKEAKDKLNDYQNNSPDQLSQVLKDRISEIDDWLARVSREYVFDNADVFFDLAVINQDFKAEKMAITDDQAVILSDQSIALFSLDSKASKIIAGGEEIKKADLIASVSPWAIYQADLTLTAIDKTKQEKIDSQKLEGVLPMAMVGYAGNVYILDAKNNQVWRFAGLRSGFAKKSPYFKKEADLSQAVSLAIDGSVWILYKDGSIDKFTSGREDGFVITGLDKPFISPEKIFTDENQENIYILDRKNTRVVVFNKIGEYKASYSWSGIAGALDMVAQEKIGKIFLLTDSRIYSLDIKD